MTVDGKELVIGTLSQGNIPQISLDLIFDQEFELSHSLETGSVHFIGYKSPNIDDEECYSSSEEEVEVPATDTANGNAGAAASSVVKADSEPKTKPAEEVKHESDDDDDQGSDSGCICFSSGWMIEMMRKMILGAKKK